jgi:hypothetical protein
MESELKLEQKSTETEVATRKATESQQLIDDHLCTSQQRQESEEIDEEPSESDSEDENEGNIVKF